MPPGDMMLHIWDMQGSGGAAGRRDENQSRGEGGLPLQLNRSGLGYAVLPEFRRDVCLKGGRCQLE